MALKEYLRERKKKKFKKKYKVGLCLSGGGTKGFCNLGVFKAFEEMGITFDAVAGTSAGSLFGSLYASGFKYEDMYKFTRNIKNSNFRKSKLGFLPSKMDILIENIKAVLPYTKIQDMPIPFYIVSADLKTGKQVVLDEGDIAYSIAGSSAIPGVYFPVKYKGMTLIDGGVVNNIPADILRARGCDFVITVDCNSTRGGGTTSTNLFTQFTASIGIMMKNNSTEGLRLSDLIIAPDLSKFNSLNVAGKDEMIEIGYLATMELKDEIEKIFLGKVKKR